jgi:hypothetical protein
MYNAFSTTCLSIMTVDMRTLVICLVVVVCVCVGICQQRAY